MPHAFKAHPKHPAVDYLVRLHADIGGRIKANKEEAERLAEDMKHVEAVLKMFDPTFSCRAISARRRVQGNPWFKRGTLFRQALEVLRNAAGPLTVEEITDAVLASKNVTGLTKKQHVDLQAGIRSSLRTNAGRTVECAGESMPHRWRLL